MQHLHEEQLSSEQLLDGKLLKVYRDHVRVPDGEESVREWIDHPGASAVVPIFEDGTTILVRQFRYPSRKVFYEVPAGKMDVEGELPEDVARRELEEETGWIPGKLIHLGSYYPCIGYSNEVIHIYLGEALEEGRQAFADGENLELLRLPFGEALAMVNRREILDMKTVVALFYADAALKERAGA
ncbi:MAG TPA: NUDIX hydrolase [Rhodothermales bacterium]|nr:NUDIX hydrolase [Rhodothermales bacterium]